VIDANGTAQWMLTQLEREGCIYQDDVVDYLTRASATKLLRENAEGNEVLSSVLLNAFRALTENNVVWVKPHFYWRWRVDEDEDGREARG
jgi:predicted nucleotidyltransferase